MAKKYILKSLGKNNDANVMRKLETNLLNLSAIGIKWNSSLIKQMRGEGAEESALNDFNSTYAGDDLAFRQHSNIAGQNDFIAFYDQSYQMRRDFLRKFALQGEIDYVLNSIADETIVNDDMHFFAYANTKRLKAVLKPEEGKQIVDGINNAYRRVYHLFHFNEGNDAWHYIKKFLVDGFLAFEVIYSTNKDGSKATDIIGFQELDPITLQPEIKKDPVTGQDIKVWIQNKGDANKERVLLDTNVIYISWAKNNFISHLSYCEHLIRTFNMLRTLENSRIIWNMQNAQKRIKIVVPAGTQSEQKIKTRLRQLEAQYKEDINIDNMSGEITVNGQPKFPFAKTFVFPSKEGVQTEISELDVQGHDLNSTEQLKWFWQRFIIETGLPKDRFNMIFDNGTSSIVPDNNTLTREEYKFNLFISRIRNIFKEVLLKPTWQQFCLHHPEFASSEVLKNSIGLEFCEENVFALAKEKAILEQGANLIQTLSGIVNADQTPVFSMKFLLQKYLSLSDDDWKLNQKMLDAELKQKMDAATDIAGQIGAQPGGGPQPTDMGGGMPADMGMEMGGAPADMGGGMPGAEELPPPPPGEGETLV